MASLIADNGKSGRTWRVQIMVDGVRRTIRIGSMTKADAVRVQGHVEALASSRIAGTPLHEQTALWLAGTPDVLRTRLEKAGLCEPRIPVAPTLTIDQLIDDYKANRFGRLKRSTQQVNEQGFQSLRITLGGATPIDKVTEAGAEDMRHKLLEAGFAEATVRRRCSVASALFRYACRRRWLDRDPFHDAEVPRSAVASKRTAYIDDADARAVLDELPNAEWRLLFTLARWGGLRVGSEPRRLTWADIDWGRGRMRIESPKTEQHDGKAERMVPLFPEVALALREAQDAVGDQGPWALPMLRGRTDASLRKTLERAIKRAGLTVWPRLWHNLRSSRQTELQAIWPGHVVCAWMGNSAAVAARHYLKVTEADFAKASAVTQIPAHSDEKPRENAGKPETPEKRKTPVITVLSGFHGGSKIAAEGLEISKDSPGETQIPTSRDANFGALPHDRGGRK